MTYFCRNVKLLRAYFFDWGKIVRFSSPFSPSDAYYTVRTARKADGNLPFFLFGGGVRKKNFTREEIYYVLLVESALLLR